jgi:pimeloyl-ACP methyl ester carboxylesterase
MTPLPEAEPFLSANPNAELTVIDKSGMLPHDEQSMAFNRLVEETISSAAHEADEKPKRKPKAKKSE